MFNSSNKKKTVIHETQETRESNQQIADGIGLALEGRDNTISFTDGGAVENMAAVTMAALQAQETQGAEAMTFAERAGRSALDFAHDAGRPDSATAQKLGLYALAAGALIVIVMVIRK